MCVGMQQAAERFWRAWHRKKRRRSIGGRGIRSIDCAAKDNEGGEVPKRSGRIGREDRENIHESDLRDLDARTVELRQECEAELARVWQKWREEQGEIEYQDLVDPTRHLQGRRQWLTTTKMTAFPVVGPTRQ